MLLFRRSWIEISLRATYLTDRETYGRISALTLSWVLLPNAPPEWRYSLHRQLCDRVISRPRDHTIHLLAGASGVTNFSGDGGSAYSATVNQPEGPALDSQGNLFVADAGNNRVREIAAGNDYDVVADSPGNVYIADWINLRIRVVDPSGIIHTVAGSGGGGYNGERLSPLQTNMLPIALAFDPNGQLYFTDSESERVRTISK